MLWAELAPFLLIGSNGDGVKALTEYLVFQEDPDHADIETLGIVLNEAVRPLGEQDEHVRLLLDTALTSHAFDWLALFSYHNLRLLRRMAGAEAARGTEEETGRR